MFDFIRKDENPDAKPEPSPHDEDAVVRDGSSIDDVPTVEGSVDDQATGEVETEQLPLATLSTTAKEDAGEEDVEARLAYDSLTRHRKQRRRKKIIRTAIIVGVVAGIGIAWWLSQKPDSGSTADSSIPTATVTRENFEDAVSASGSVKPVSSVVVTPEVDGIIDQVNVQEGSVVNAGDTLFTIKNDSLDKAVKQAEIDLKTAKNTTSASYATYSNAYDAYYSDTGTEQAVYDTQSAYENAVLAQQTAQQNYDNAVAQAAKRTVTAPTAGSIVVMNAISGSSLGSTGTSGSTGTTSGSLIQIADLSQMTVTVQINESDISKIAVGQSATVTFSALPGVTLDATVTHISTMATGDSSSGSTGIVTYGVDLLIPSPVAELKPGMTASVSIKLQSVPDALTVPSSALVQVGDSTYSVYVVTDAQTGAAEEREVTIVAKNTSTAVIEGNVSEGDLVQLLGYSSSSTGGDNTASAAAVAY